MINFDKPTKAELASRLADLLRLKRSEISIEAKYIVEVHKTGRCVGIPQHGHIDLYKALTGPKVKELREYVQERLNGMVDQLIEEVEREIENAE